MDKIQTTLTVNNNKRSEGEALRNAIDKMQLIIDVMPNETPSKEALRGMLAAIIEGSRQMHASLKKQEDLTIYHRRSAEIDHLTQIFNRRGLESAIKDMVDANIEKVRVGERIYYMCIAIDLDDFKPINTALGHQGGDIALQTFTRVLKGSMRVTDFVAKREYHEGRSIESRTGGDEFLVVLPMSIPSYLTSTQDVDDYIQKKKAEIINKIKDSLHEIKFKKDGNGEIISLQKIGEPEVDELVLGASINAHVCKHDEHATHDDVNSAIDKALNDADAELEKIKKIRREEIMLEEANTPTALDYDY